MKTVPWNPPKPPDLALDLAAEPVSNPRQEASKSPRRGLEAGVVPTPLGREGPVLRRLSGLVVRER